eukprot:scaffold64659_cov33-Phaeocystis_antarctica.AAC.1
MLLIGRLAVLQKGSKAPFHTGRTSSHINIKRRVELRLQDDRAVRKEEDWRGSGEASRGAAASSCRARRTTRGGCEYSIPCQGWLV